MEAYQQSVDEVLLALGTDGRRGLSDGEARARLESFGKNELTAEKPLHAMISKGGSRARFNEAIILEGLHGLRL
jgi:magnesium-transporting ATPase (P-type)